MTQVEGTNDYSIVSKLSAANAGYFDDKFLHEFVEKPRARAPLINWGYYIRNKSIELTFEKAVQFFAARGQDFQILSVGAGFDTTFFNVLDKYNPDNMVFFEIDLPSNVERKVNLIFNSSKCQPLIWKKVMNSNDGKSINTDIYRLFSCDLADTGQLKKSLVNFNFDFTKPTLILSECVITYMKEKASTNLIKFLSRELDSAAFFVYEQCSPEDGFGSFMVKHFEKIGSPILGLEKYRSTEEQVDRYLEAGWNKCKVHTLTNIVMSLDETEIRRVENLEQFDEFEEFFLKCSHYFMLVATQGSCDIVHGVVDLKSYVRAESHYFHLSDDPLKLKPVDSGNLLKRFGHCMVASEHIRVFGGFGEVNNKHKRLGEYVSFQYDKGRITKDVQVQNPLFERQFGSCVEWNGKICLIGGRLSPQKPLKELVFINPETGECIESCTVPEIGARWRHSTCILADTLVIVGGRDQKKVYDDVVLYNLKERLVKKINLDFPLLSCSVCTWGQKIVISGGMNPVSAPVNHTWNSSQEAIIILQYEGDEVKQKKVLLDIEPRFGHTSHVVHNHLLLVGGVGPSGPAGVDCVNLISGQVTRHRLPSFRQSKENNILMLHNHTSFIQDDELVIVGGGGNCFSFGTHINPTYSIHINQLIKK